MNNDKEFDLLVFGSQNFQDQKTIFDFLDILYIATALVGDIAGNNGHVGTIHVGNFGGADTIVREWAKKHDIKVVDFDLGTENVSHEVLDRTLPSVILENESKFIDAVNKMKDAGIDAFTMIPAPNGEYGSTTTNIIKLARKAGIPEFDGKDAISILQANKPKMQANKSRNYNFY